MRAMVKVKKILWSDAMLIPRGFGEREAQPRSQRWPEDLAKQVEKIALETRQDFTTALFHLVKWACDEYQHQRTAESSASASKKKGST